MEKLLKTLCDTDGISGYEYKISEKISDLMRPYADEVIKDNLGNLIIVKKCGKENAKKVMIDAHMDKIGFMVTDIDKNGFIHFTSVGGIDLRTLPASVVTVHAKEDLMGVIGATPPHLMDREDAKNSVKIEEMVIDVGMSAEKVKGIVSIGDSITIALRSHSLGNGIFSGRSVDNRAGILVLIETLKTLSKINLEVDLYFVASVMEEVGLRGAKVSGYEIEPDIAIVVDVTHASCATDSKTKIELGSGVAIAKGPNIHPLLVDRIIKTAKDKNIKYSLEIESSSTGTNAWALQVSGEGIPTALLSIPLRYMHTAVETVDVNDIKQVCELIVQFVSQLDSDMEEWLCF